MLKFHRLANRKKTHRVTAAPPDERTLRADEEFELSGGEEELGGDWEVGGPLGGGTGNRGMEGWDCVGGQALTLTFLFSTLSFTHSLARSLGRGASRKEGRKDASVCK